MNNKELVRYKLTKIKNGKPFFGEVIVTIELLPNATSHQIVEAYEGAGFQGQGYLEVISENDYSDWKQGIRNGIDYALKMLKGEDKYKVTILEGNGLSTDTNAVILAYIASRVILDKMAHKESKAEKDQLEELVFSSWDYAYDSQINFDNFTIEKS